MSSPGPRRFDFHDHRRELGGNQYVYAVVSRRARGLSVGVNLNRDKRCNFDCPYCQVDRSTPGGPSGVDVARLIDELTGLLAQLRHPDLWLQPPYDGVAAPLRRVADIAFSGDGEPTSASAFPEAARAVRSARDALGLTLPLRLLTNATLLERPRVRSTLASFDELWCKLDAGSEAGFQAASGSRLSFAHVLRNLTAVACTRPITLQSLFLARDGQPPDAAEIAAYIERLDAILQSGGAIDQVQVYTVARRPADARVTPLGASQLEAIAARIRALGVRADVFP